MMFPMKFPVKIALPGFRKNVTYALILYVALLLLMVAISVLFCSHLSRFALTCHKLAYYTPAVHWECHCRGVPALPVDKGVPTLFKESRGYPRVVVLVYPKCEAISFHYKTNKTSKPKTKPKKLSHRPAAAAEGTLLTHNHILLCLNTLYCGPYLTRIFNPHRPSNYRAGSIGPLHNIPIAVKVKRKMTWRRYFR